MILTLILAAWVQEPVYSGPQKGEPLPPLKVLDMTGPDKGKDVDLVADAGGSPAVWVFIHEITRQAAQVLTAIDRAAAVRPSLKAAFVLLTADMNATEQRTPMMQESLQYRTRWTVSPDGKEGPGAYGLNKTVTLTVLLARNNVVTANWAIVSPSDVDAPPIVKAIADLVPADPVAELKLEVETLRRENARLKAQIEKLKSAPGGEARPATSGRAPTDPDLNGAMRRIVRKDASDAEVDAAIAAILERLKARPELRPQVVDGYTLLVDLKYGGEYARKRLQEALQEIRK
jgi:hypothetical protein